MAADTTKDATLPADSQAQLAMSIARAVQRELPEGDSEAEIALAVEQALEVEARRNEEWLASVRVGLFGAVAVVALGAVLVPGTFGRASYPWWPAVAAAVALAVAVAFAAALPRFYRPRIRRMLPLLDAALLGAATLAFPASVSDGPGLPASYFAIVAAAAAFLAFSGSLRLSRRAAQLSTLLAIVIWSGAAVSSGIRLVPASLIGGLILGAGVLSARIPRITRRVVTPEIARLRLARLYEDARAAIQAREQVLHIVSHDLRNPLSTVSMGTGLLLEEDVSEQERVHYLQSIRRAGLTMQRMIEDLLNVARIEAGKLPIEPAPARVADLLQAAHDLMDPIAAAEDLVITDDASETLPLVRADAERINQVFSNLIGNAVKFTPGGGTITLGATFDGDRVRLSVRDTGPGIPPEHLDRIFRSLWQADDRDTRGIGLGLTIARSIVNAHGEELCVRNHPGGGAEFYFYLPRVSPRRT